MIRELIYGIKSNENFQQKQLVVDHRISEMEKETYEFLNDYGFHDGVMNENGGILDEIIDKLKTIKDQFKLNRIYSFLFKDELRAEISNVLHSKGIVSSNDTDLITSWIISTDSSLSEKMDFIKQISSKADNPIINLSKRGDFEKYSGSIYVLQDLIINKHPTLEQMLDLAIDWTPGGSSGGGASSPGPGEGMLKLLSYNTVPVKKGDVKLGNNLIEVKGNVKGNDGGALAGGKGASGWQAIDENLVLETEFGVFLENLDLRLIKKTFENDWVKALEIIGRTNGKSLDENFRDSILLLSVAYFSKSKGKSSLKNFKKNLKKISFKKMTSDSERKRFWETFCFFNYEYYKEMEGFDYLFLVQYTERKCTFITSGDDFWAVSDSLKIKYGDFKWNTPQGAFRLGLK